MNAPPRFPRQAKAPRMSALEALADPDYREGDIDIMEFIPPRTVEGTRFAFADADERSSSSTQVTSLETEGSPNAGPQWL